MSCATDTSRCCATAAISRRRWSRRRSRSVRRAKTSSQTVLAYNSLGLIYYKMEKLELAETALRKALDLDAKSAFVWNNLGLVAFERGHDQEAFLNFQKASELDPKYVEARLNKAVVFMDCGDYKHARAELQRAVESIPTTPTPRSRWASPRAATASWTRRAARTRRRWTSSPNYAPALYDLGDPVHGLRQGSGQGEGLPSTQFMQIADSDDPQRAGRGSAPEGAASDPAAILLARSRCWRGPGAKAGAAAAKPARRGRRRPAQVGVWLPERGRRRPHPRRAGGARRPRRRPPRTRQGHGGRPRQAGVATGTQELQEQDLQRSARWTSKESSRRRSSSTSSTG